MEVARIWKLIYPPSKLSLMGAFISYSIGLGGPSYGAVFRALVFLPWVFFTLCSWWISESRFSTISIWFLTPGLSTESISIKPPVTAELPPCDFFFLNQPSFPSILAIKKPTIGSDHTKKRSPICRFVDGTQLYISRLIRQLKNIKSSKKRTAKA